MESLIRDCCNFLDEKNGGFYIINCSFTILEKGVLVTGSFRGGGSLLLNEPFSLIEKFGGCRI